MAAEQTPDRHQDDRDHELWTRFFVAALSSASALIPAVVAHKSAEIADAALVEERRRRRQEPGQPEESVYTTRGVTSID